MVVRVGEKGVYIVWNGGRKRMMKKVVGYRGGLMKEMDMEELFRGLVMGVGEEEGVVVREEIEVDEGVERWLLVYWMGEKGREKVKDVIGGGNIFLGGLGVVLVRGKGIEEVVGWGVVVVSFVIE